MERDSGKFGHKRMRDWYFEGYKPKEVTESNGRVRIQYEYHGKYYSFGLDKSGMGRMKKRFALLTLLCLAVYAVGLFLPSRLGMSLPGAIYLFFIMPFAYYIIGFSSFLTLKPEFTTREMYSSVRRMYFSVWGMAILGGVSVVVSVYYWIAKVTAVSVMLELGFVLCGIAATALSIVLIRMSHKYEYSVVRDESEDEDF